MTETVALILVAACVLGWILRRTGSRREASTEPGDDADASVEDMVLHDMTVDEDDEMIGGGLS